MSVTIDKNKENKTNIQASETSQIPKKERVYSPPANVFEDNTRAIFVVDMPGVTEKDLEISLEKGLLTIEGKVSLEPKEGFSREYGERKVDVFRRKFTLGKMVDAENAVAKLANGQLHLTLPKQEPVKKKIPIHTN